MHVLKSKKENITLKYGKQKLNGAPYNHTGIDIIKKVASCDYITAAQKGKVVAIVTNIKGKKDGSYGNYVMLEHAGGVRTLYAHMKYGTVTVKKGQVVNAGTVLGYMGATGNAFGAHLHFEVRVNNKCTDPLPYLQDKKAIKAYAEPKPAPAKKKTVKEIAKEVIAGKWGNGAARKTKLEKAGYNYKEVQSMVNKLLK